MPAPISIEVVVGHWVAASCADFLRTHFHQNELLSADVGQLHVIRSLVLGSILFTASIQVYDFSIQFRVRLA